MASALVRRYLALCMALGSAFAPLVAPATAVAAANPPLPGDATFLSVVQAARDAFDRQEYHQAATLYERVIRENPVNPDHWRRLAAAHYLAGEYRESIPAYEMALKLRQDQPATLAYFLARAYAKAGDAASGMRWLRQAMQWGYPNVETARADDALGALRTQQASTTCSASWTLHV
jgi:tetratricopeptide (TPR) repeat protein